MNQKALPNCALYNYVRGIITFISLHRHLWSFPNMPGIERQLKRLDVHPSRHGVLETEVVPQIVSI